MGNARYPDQTDALGALHFALSRRRPKGRVR